MSCMLTRGIPDRVRNDGDDGSDEEVVILNLIQDPLALASDVCSSGGFRIESGMTEMMKRSSS